MLARLPLLVIACLALIAQACQSRTQPDNGGPRAAKAPHENPCPPGYHQDSAGVPPQPAGEFCVLDSVGGPVTP